MLRLSGSHHRVRRHKAYVEPTLVLYTSATFSACGTVTPNDGANFYCPSDQKIYFDPDGVSTYAPAGDPLGDYLTV